MMNKRILGIILTISMLLSMCEFSLTAQAALGIEHEEEVSKLNAFGILTGYPDTSYKASSTVSAKDFVNAAYKTAGLSGDFTSAMAQKFGFDAADNTITVQAAAAVLLSALSYDAETELYGGFPEGYIKVSSTNGLLVGIKLSLNENLTNDAMAVMLYNALEINAMKLSYSNGQRVYTKDDETVMNKLGIYEAKGIITGTEYAALDGSSKASGNEIKINDDKSYGLGRTYADELFGYSVEFYYNDDDELLWIEPRKNMTAIKVAEVDVTNLSTDKIVYKYDDTSKKKTYLIDDNATFVYNGISIENPDLTEFVPISGYVTIIDNNNDNKADVISCEAYEHYLVSEKNDNNISINDYETGRTFSLNPDDYNSMKIIKNGQIVSYSDIVVGDVIAVVRSDEAVGAILKVYVSSYKAVSGTVKAISDSYIKIGSEVYEIGTGYEGTALSVGRIGTFYFDINGNLIRCVKGQGTTSQYAYLMSIYVGDDGSTCYIQFLTAGNSIEEHQISSKVKYNNSTLSAVDVCRKLRTGDSVNKQLITYSLNSDGEVNKLETANQNNMYSGLDKESDDFSLYFQGHGRYRKNNLCFNSKYLIDADTPIFIVPASREKEDYEIRYAASLTNGTSYYVSVYDIDEFMTAGAIVLDEVASDPESLKAKRCIIVEKISYSVNDDEDDIIIVEGYQQGSKITLKTKDEDLLKDSEGKYYSLGCKDGYEQVSAGDIIQASVDANGYLVAFRTLYKADEEKKKLVIADNDTPNEYEEGGNVNEFSDMFVLHGTVVSRTSGILVVDSDTKRAHRITSGAGVYIVDGKSIEKGTTSDICIDDEVYLHTYQGNLQEVVIYR